MIHPEQGSQFSSGDWRSFLKANNLLGSMSRRSNCDDNAVAESFFKLPKRERIKRKIYSTRQDALGDVFDYIEMVYNPKRRHGFNNQLSPVEFEKQYLISLESAEGTRGDSPGLSGYERLENDSFLDKKSALGMGAEGTSLSKGARELLEMNIFRK